MSGNWSSASWSSARRGLANLAVTGLVALGIAAATTPRAEAACGVSVVNVKHGPKYDNYNHGPDWEVIGQHGDTLSFTNALAYTNSFTATVTLSAQVVSAAVGVTVGKTLTTQTGTTFAPPSDGHRWALQAGTVDHTITFDVKNDCGGVVGHGSVTARGAVTVRHFQLETDGYRATPGVSGGGGRPGPSLSN